MMSQESLPFTIVKLYFENIYVGWQTRKPDEPHDEAYFIKVEDSGESKYFMLGHNEQSFHVEES